MTGGYEGLEGLDLVPIPTYRGQPPAVPGDLVGTDLNGDRLTVPVVGTDRWTILLFLSSHCDGCRVLWDGLASPDVFGPPEHLRVVPVTRGPEVESAAALRLVVPPGVEPVMCEAAWSRYGVTGAPFFALVDGAGSGRVVTEGVAWGVEQTAGHVRRARAGDPEPEVARLSTRHREPVPPDGAGGRG